MSECLEHIPTTDPSEEGKHDRAFRRKLNLGKFRQDDFFQESRNHQPDDSARRLPIRDAQLPARDSRRALVLHDEFAQPTDLNTMKPIHTRKSDAAIGKNQDQLDFEPYSTELSDNNDHYLPEDVGGSWTFGPEDHQAAPIYNKGESV